MTARHDRPVRSEHNSTALNSKPQSIFNSLENGGSTVELHGLKIICSAAVRCHCTGPDGGEGFDHKWLVSYTPKSTHTDTQRVHCV